MIRLSRTSGLLGAAGLLAAFFLFRALGRNAISPSPAASVPPDSFQACILSQIHFSPKRSTNSVRIRMLTIPDRSDHQTLLSRTASPLPTDSGSDAGGKWLEWNFASPAESASIILVQCAKRHRHDLSTPASTRTTLEDPSLFLGTDSLHPLEHPLLASLAASVPPGTPEERTRWIWDTVRTRLRYGGYQSVDQGALRALASGSGDCSEFSDLQATLMRIQGIPARTPRGWTLSGNKTESHQWVEGYLPDRGWTEFDPLWAALGHHPIERVGGLRLELSHHPSGPAMGGQSRATWSWTGEEPTFTWRDSLWRVQ